MKPIETSIGASYRPKWGPWEGFREIVQNALDAGTDGHALSYEFSAGRQEAVFRNAGAFLERAALLMGETTKSAGGYIGRHGDGLKIGLLALIREGCTVEIRQIAETWTDAAGVYRADRLVETWTPEIVESEVYHRQVLAFRIETHKAPTWDVPAADWTGVEVAIGNLRSDQWEAFSRQIHGLTCPYSRVYGDGRSKLFLDPEAKGKVFTHGIFVCDDRSLSFGYDLADLTLDVDRKVPEGADLKHKIGMLVSSVVGKYKDDHAFVNAVLGAVSEGAAEFEYLRYHIGYQAGAKEAVVEHYARTAGSAEPVSVTDMQDHDAKRYAIPIRPVSAGYYGLLESAGVAKRHRLDEASMDGIDPMPLPDLDTLDRLRGLEPMLSHFGDRPKMIPAVFHGKRSAEYAAFVGGVVYLSNQNLGSVNGCIDTVLAGLALARKEPVRDLAMTLVYATFGRNEEFVVSEAIRKAIDDDIPF